MFVGDLLHGGRRQCNADNGRLMLRTRDARLGCTRMSLLGERDRTKARDWLRPFARSRRTSVCDARGLFYFEFPKGGENA